MTRPLTIVTGGTRGIGAAIALRLADAGHDLVLGYAGDTAAAQDCHHRVRQRGAECDLVAGDITSPKVVDALFAVAARRGLVTGVVNNAGITRILAPLADTPVEVIQRSIAVNLTAPLLVARSAVRAMSRAHGGSGGVLVNISSGAATIGSPGEYVHYAAAKAGIDTLTLGLAAEVGPDGVRVVGVAPGAVRTRIHADAGDPGRLDRIGAQVPLRRPGEPADVAEAVAWLMSDAAGYVTGTTLRVTGGR